MLLTTKLEPIGAEAWKEFGKDQGNRFTFPGRVFETSQIVDYQLHPLTLENQQFHFSFGVFVYHYLFCSLKFDYLILYNENMSPWNNRFREIILKYGHSAWHWLDFRQCMS